MKEKEKSNPESMFACNTGQKENCVIGSLLGYVDAKMWMIKFSTEYFKKNIKKYIDPWNYISDT